MTYNIGDECIFCGMCVVNCPSEAISTSDFLVEIDPDLCTGCETCVSVCPMGAITAAE